MSFISVSMLRKVFVLNIDEMECSSILSNTTSFLTWLNWKTSNDSKPIKRNQATSKYLSSELSISCRYSVEVLLKHYSVSYTSQRISNGWWFNNSLFPFFSLTFDVLSHFTCGLTFSQGIILIYAIEQRNLYS